MTSRHKSHLISTCFIHARYMFLDWLQKYIDTYFPMFSSTDLWYEDEQTSEQSTCMLSIFSKIIMFEIECTCLLL